jgi:2,3-bisphosphoglycerate-independent phosphoglycerate mutase
LIVNGIGKKSNEIEKSIIDSYNNQITDEFIEPIVVVDNKNLPLAKIEDNDVVIFFNFRTDRGRQLTEALSQNDFNDFSMKKLNLKFLTMTNYNDNYKNIDCIYENENLSQTLGEV